MATGKLIKQNPKERNEVWEFEDFFRKKWLYNNESWLSTHYKLLEQNCPTGYLKGWGSNENEMWLDTNRIKLDDVYFSDINKTIEAFRKVISSF